MGVIYKNNEKKFSVYNVGLSCGPEPQIIGIGWMAFSSPVMLVVPAASQNQSGKLEHPIKFRECFSHQAYGLLHSCC